MRYIHLQSQLNAVGWIAEMVDSDTWRNGYKAPCTHIYAVRGSERVFLCSFARMWQMSRRRCEMLIAALPVEQETQPVLWEVPV